MRINVIILVWVTALFFISCAGNQTASSIPQSTATLTASQKETSEVEWQKILAEAKKEGRVVIYGVPGVDIREAMVKEFQKAYPGITVEYTGLPGGEVAPKILAERRAGIYLPDLQIGGTGAIVGTLEDASQALEPLLILPEVKNTKNWLGGKLEFADKKGKVNLVMSSYLSSFVLYNNKLLEPEKVKTLSLWDIIKPEWKGKVLVADPRIPGSGAALGSFLYHNSQLGPDFIRALAKNESILVRDARQLVEWVSSAKNPVGLAPNTQIVLEFTKIGAPIDILYQVKEGGYIAAGFGSVIVLDKAPHQNAAKVYLNWLLSKEGQYIFSKTMNIASRRIDVPTDYLNPGVLPQQGVQYFETYSADAIDKRAAAYDFWREVFGR